MTAFEKSSELSACLKQTRNLWFGYKYFITRKDLRCNTVGLTAFSAFIYNNATFIWSNMSAYDNFASVLCGSENWMPIYQNV